MSVAVLVCAAAATLSTSASVGAVTGHAVTTQEAVVAPIISVTQVPAAISLGPCSGGAADLHYQTVNDAESFTLRIVAVTEPCTPIEAVAVAYRMPDGSFAWPQSLVERRELRIERAGTVDVRFAKECVPLQFDVVTGATPDTIAPWAQWHGPLLFDGDVGSSWQHRPAANCAGPTSTVLPTTDSPSTVAPSSSTTLSSTSVPSTPTSEAGGDSSTTPSTASVLGATISATPSTAPEVLDTSVGRSGPTRVGGLALTGAAVNVLFVAGLVTLLVGLALVMLPRRRSGN